MPLRVRSAARAGLTQLGLPYAQDAVVTRHLTAFLGRQVNALAEVEGLQSQAPEGATLLHPTAVLFNGGGFKSTLLVERVMNTLNAWLAARLIEGADLDHRGRTRRGLLRLRARRQGRADSQRHGARVLHRGRISDACRAGTRARCPRCASRPPAWKKAPKPNCRRRNSGWWSASRCIFASSVRWCGVRRRSARCSITGKQELQELEKIEASLPSDGRTPGEVVPVRLHARVTEAGTLELEAVPHNSDER